MSDRRPHHGKEEFYEYKAAQRPPKTDAAIFEQAAANMTDGKRPVAAILDAGGTRQHVNHFSMQKCAGKPVDPWADSQEEGIVRAELISVAEELKGLM